MGSVQNPATKEVSAVNELPRLICFDLDGTVYTPGRRRLTPRVRRAFARCHGAGAIPCVVSGRQIQMIDRALLAEPWLDALITINGAASYLDDRQTPVHAYPLPAERCLALMDAVADLSPLWMLLTLEGAYEQQGFMGYMSQPVVGPRSAARHLAREAKHKLEVLAGRSPVHSVESIRPLIEAGTLTPAKLNLKCRTDAEYAEALGRIRDFEGLEVVDMGYSEAEITVAGANKGRAIDELRRLLGIELEDSVMFGDSSNDLPALGHVGTFVAVENAAPSVKDRAQEICPSVHQDGVAQWLEQHLDARG
jgi:Cof subfamily protein (haloacid dehalogenase superfamily)